jgi:predicted ATPase
MTGPLSDRFVVISGCSGGGKSTLLAELARRGHTVIEEPGRRVIAETLAGDGSALPWIDMQAFARRAIGVSLRDRANAQHHEGWVFFDRGVIDAALALVHASGESAAELLCREHRYHREVFLTPPWPEIYRHDADRRHDIAVAVDEYERLLTAYPRLGYEVVILPKAPVEDRADFLLERLGA